MKNEVRIAILIVAKSGDTSDAMVRTLKCMRSGCLEQTGRAFEQALDRSPSTILIP